MFKKLFICLTQPGKIGLYIFQKIRFSILFLAIFLLIATIPYGILFVIHGGNLSNVTVENIERTFMSNGLDFELEINNGLLTGKEGIAAGTNELILFINPNKEENPYALYDSGVPLIEFKEDKIIGSISGLVVFEKTYLDVNLLDFDFNEIMNLNYLKFHELVFFLLFLLPGQQVPRPSLRR